MTAYYNEFEPYAAQWLRNLISKNFIAPGDVDVRSITEVSPDDLQGYAQCHFFAGIGGWSLALRLAGWADNVPVWTGSCPCQSFSTAGKRKGKADERHLWPDWKKLIHECRPATVFGEQTKDAIAHEWLDEVIYDLENENYAIGSAVLPACGVKIPHQRYRLYFVANASIEDDGINNCLKSEGQEPKFRSGFYSLDDYSRTRRLFGRPIPNASIPLMAHGISERLGAYKAYGNAIVPQVAAEFISAFMECRP